MNNFNQNSKGFAFTTFAILAASLIVMMVSVQVNQSDEVRTADADRIGEASFFLQSAFSDIDRSLGIATRRALTSTTNYVIETGEPLEDSEAGVSEALANGTLNGEKLNQTGNASLSDWSSRVSEIADRSGYELEVEIKNYSFNRNGFDIESSFTVFGQLKDPSTLAQFNQTASTDSTTSIEGVEDIMILLRSKGRYVAQYSQCGFSEPAEVLYTGTQNSSGYTHGYAEINPSDISAVSNRSDKVLVVDNVDGYSSSEVNNFAGAVSEDSSSDTSQYTTNFVFNTGSIGDIEQGMSLILSEDQVWRSNFRQMFKENCYIEDSDGPGFFDRMENKLVNDDGKGLATLIDVGSLPDELQKSSSAVGYVYFSESGSYGVLREIRGVTDEYSWFRIDQDHIDKWGLEELSD